METSPLTMIGSSVIKRLDDFQILVQYSHPKVFCFCYFMFLMKLDLFMKFHEVKRKKSVLKTYFSKWLKDFTFKFF